MNSLNNKKFTDKLAVVHTHKDDILSLKKFKKWRHRRRRIWLLPLGRPPSNWRLLWRLIGRVIQFIFLNKKKGRGSCLYLDEKCGRSQISR